MRTTSEYDYSGYDDRTAPPPPPRVEPSLADLIKQVRDETITLFRQEVSLAKAEVSEKLSRVGRNAAFLIAGGALAYAGLLFLLLAAAAGIYVLLTFAGLYAVGLWLAPLIVGVLVIAIGGMLVQKGISALSRESAVPERTAQSIREDKAWLTHRHRIR